MLEKEYFLRCTPDQIDPFSFDGPVIYHSKGTQIQWKPGKDVSVQVERDTGGKEFEVKVESFFTFFDPPRTPRDDDSGTFENDVSYCLMFPV